MGEQMGGVADIEGLGRSWVNDRFHEAVGGEIAHVNPATKSPIGNSFAIDLDGVDHAVKAADVAFRTTWGRFSAKERKRALFRLAELIEANAARLAQLETVEVGRPTTDAANVVRMGADMVRDYACMIDRISGDVTTLEDSTIALSLRRPRGVVAAITPWNFPVMNVLVRLAPALAAGNSVVLKPSEYSPRSAVLLGQLASEAGIPGGTVNIILGSGPEIGRALVSHPLVNLVAFTGSTRTGLEVSRAAASEAPKPVLLECGGKSPQVVLPDALDDEGIWGPIFFSAFWNSGQWCSARTRLLVPAAKRDSAIDGLRSAAKYWRLGNPSDPATMLGPIVSEKQFNRVSEFYDVAEKSGEVVDLGCPDDGNMASGFYARPSVAINQPRAGVIAQEEVFGPLLSLETFADPDDALRLANASEYGLMASVWTNVADEGQKFAHGLEAGAVMIYTSGASAARGTIDFSNSYLEPRKKSGSGLDGGIPGLLAYTTAKMVSWMT